MNLANSIVLDIETGPDLDWIERTTDAFIESLEPPANYKKPEAIDKWIEERVAERLERAPLSPIDGRVIAVAYAQGEGDETPTVVIRDSEREILRAVVEGIQRLRRPLIAGWHIEGFDIPFLSARCALHRLPLPTNWPNVARRGQCLDGYLLLGQGKLDMWLRRFDLPTKTGHGRDAHRLRADELASYVANDVHVERLLLQRLAEVLPFLHRDPS